MSGKLAMVAGTGLVVCVACLVAAAAFGGKSLRNGGLDGVFDGWGGERCDVSGGGAQASRSLDWNGGDKVTIEIPANVHYQRGQGDKLVIKGDAALLPLVRLEDGHLKLRCRLRHFDDRLDVTLPGRDFRAYALNGSADMNLAGIDQPRLKITVAGSGDVTASGKAGEFDYALAGSGDGDFSALDAGTVSVSIAGSGDASVMPHDRLDVNIAGSGDITLRSEPRRLETHIAGSGKIVHTDGSVTRSSGLVSRSMGDDAKDD